MTVDFSADSPGREFSLNFNNSNAALVLEALGLLGRRLEGKCSIAEARRGVIRAKALPVPRTRPERSEFRTSTPSSETVIPIRRLRSYDSGCTAEQVLERVQMFSDFVERAASAGATTIYWS